MMADDTDLIPAATVLLLRSPEMRTAGDRASEHEMEVLMLRRNSKIAFGGMWVFPGGRVDDDEMIVDDPLASARVAAVREVEEETGLHVEGSRLKTWSYWVPPLLPAVPSGGPRRRFSTWFFVVEAPDGDVAIDHGEIHEHRWLTPSTALAQHRAGEIELVPPTWITLTQLSAHTSVDAAMKWAAETEPEEFRTRPIGKEPVTIAWEGDAAYDRAHEGGPVGGDGSSTGSSAEMGPRHRLILNPGAWDYQRTI